MRSDSVRRVGQRGLLVGICANLDVALTRRPRHAWTLRPQEALYGYQKE